MDFNFSTHSRSNDVTRTIINYSQRPLVVSWNSVGRNRSTHNLTIVTSRDNQTKAAKIPTVRNHTSKASSDRVLYLSSDYFDGIPLLYSPHPCDHSTQMLIFIHSATDNAERRQFIRSTWAKASNFDGINVRLVFILGTMDNPTTHKTEQLQKEMRIHNDIAQFGFRDVYANITHKHLLALRWVKEFCWQAHYTVKADDDVIVNIKELINYVFYSNQNLTGFHCNIIHKSIVPRKKDKYYISPAVYPSNYWPDFCQGLFYIADTITLRHVYQACNAHAYFHLDDVFLTGIIALKLNISRTQWPEEDKTKVLYSPSKMYIAQLKPHVFVCLQYVKNMDLFEMVWRQWQQKIQANRTLQISH